MASTPSVSPSASASPSGSGSASPSCSLPSDGWADYVFQNYTSVKIIRWHWRSDANGDVIDILTDQNFDDTNGQIRRVVTIPGVGDWQPDANYDVRI